MSRIRVLHLLKSLDADDGGRLVADIAEEMHGSCYDIRVGCLSSKGALAEALSADGVEVFCMNMVDGFDRSLVPCLACAIGGRNIDIVHAHSFAASFWGRFAARRVNKPVMVSHERSTRTIDRWWRRWLDCWSLGLVDRIITCSSALQRRFLRAGYPMAHLTTIRTGIRPEEGQQLDIAEGFRAQLGISADTTAVAVVGAHDYMKRGKTILESLPHLLNSTGSGDTFALLILGDGPFRRDLEDIATGIAKRYGRLDICFLEQQTDIRASLLLADMCVCCSSNEPALRAMLEAAVNEIPVIAAEVGSNRETLAFGAGGWLYPATDSATLASTITQVHSHHDVACDRVKILASYVRNEYGLSDMVRRLDSLYQILLAEKGTSRSGGGASDRNSDVA